MGLVVHDRALWSRGWKPFGSELTLAFTHTPVFSTTPLSPLLDAEYGYASFTAAGGPAQYEVRVQTTGLLIRKLGS
jgi:hypothetical protein